MIYTFQGGGITYKLNIDRKLKYFSLLSEQTNNQWYNQAWWKLFGTSKVGDKLLHVNDMQLAMRIVNPMIIFDSIREMRAAETLTDDDFEKLLITSFAKEGYTLINKNANQL